MTATPPDAPEDRRSEWRCPICRKPVTTDAERFPFCSKRCKMVDLDRWFQGEYTISRPVQWDEDIDDEEMQGQ